MEVGDVEEGLVSRLVPVVDKQGPVTLEQRELVVGLVGDLYLPGLVAKAVVDAQNHALFGKCADAHAFIEKCNNLFLNQCF